MQEPVLFKPIRQITVSHATLTVISFVDFGPYMNSFQALEIYVDRLKQLSDIIAIPENKLMKNDLSVLADIIPT